MPSAFDDRPSHRHTQRVLNQAWPPHPDRYRHGHQVLVRVRLDLERDGQVILDGTAVTWSRHHVKVSVADPRLQVPWVWLDPGDVRRR